MSLENVVPSCTEDDEETLGQIFYDRVATAVGNRIRECGPRVPVITGERIFSVLFIHPLASISSYRRILITDH